MELTGAKVKYLRVREFDVIRVRCNHKGCEAVFELHPAKVEAAMKKTNASCPLCGQSFAMQDVEGGADMVTQLARVIMALAKLRPHVSIELPVLEPHTQDVAS